MAKVKEALDEIYVSMEALLDEIDDLCFGSDDDMDALRLPFSTKSATHRKIFSNSRRFPAPQPM